MLNRNRVGHFLSPPLPLPLVDLRMLVLHMHIQRRLAPVAVAAAIRRALIVFLNFLVSPPALPLAVFLANSFEIVELHGPSLDGMMRTLRSSRWR